MIPVNAAYKKTIFYYCYGYILMFIHALVLLYVRWELSMNITSSMKCIQL